MRLASTIAAALSLAACGQPDVIAEEADTNALPAINTTAPSPTGARPDNAVSTESGAPAEAMIPAALQGRWGLSPRDCMSPIGDARGLLIINSEELRFYESRAVPAAGVQTSANSISGNFAFTGEGQSWTRHQTFELRGTTLVRTDRDPVATFRYVRC